MRQRSDVDLWHGVPDADWNDWKWQVRNKIRDVETLSKVVNLTETKKREIAEVLKTLRMEISPYFSLLLDPDDEECPLRKQVVPDIRELQIRDWEFENIQYEDKIMTDFGVVHLYPDRIAYFSSHVCGSLCRHCFRKWTQLDTDSKFKPMIDANKMIDWVREHKDVRDVLLTGGDALTLSDEQIDYILGKLFEIDTVEMVRLGTRLPIYVPQRITESLVEVLRKYRPVYIDIQVNHPRELTDESKRAVSDLVDSGAVLSNQSVLLRGVNDSVEVQRKLGHELLKIRCRPYYLFQCDQAQGLGHLRTTISKGLEIMEGLHGWTSGLAIPHYAIGAAPGGGEKVPLGPETFIKIPGTNKVMLRTYKNETRFYIEPEEKN